MEFIWTLLVIFILGPLVMWDNLRTNKDYYKQVKEEEKKRRDTKFYDAILRDITELLPHFIEKRSKKLGLPVPDKKAIRVISDILLERKDLAIITQKELMQVIDEELMAYQAYLKWAKSTTIKEI